MPQNLCHNKSHLGKRESVVQPILSKISKQLEREKMLKGMDLMSWTVTNPWSQLSAPHGTTNEQGQTMKTIFMEWWGQYERIELCLLFCDTTPHPNTERLENILPVRFVERIAEPTRGTKKFGVTKVLSCTIRYRLINAYLRLLLQSTKSVPVSIREFPLLI